MQNEITSYENASRETNPHEHDPVAVLQAYFGYNNFREGQLQLIKHLLSGKDVLGIMPTGSGKSLCFQIPALMLPGTTIVISPLIALMRDQVMALHKRGISAAYINSTLTDNEYQNVLKNAACGEYKLIYVAPERCWTRTFLQFVRKIHIGMIAIDEAHCVSQWGQNFRTSYLELNRFISSLPTRPVVGAFTATATKQVQSDMIEFLGLQNPRLFTTGFNRENLYFCVQKPENKEAFLLALLKAHRKEIGIIYCSTRKKVDELHILLNKSFPCAKYHGGMSNKNRELQQEAFFSNKKPVIIATNAFGMGIDKPDIAFVVHFNMPLSLENYYQEAGRAGRDGKPALCSLLYSAGDVRMNQFLIRNSHPDDGDNDPTKRKEDISRNMDLLQKMISYCFEVGCLRSFIRKYFGEDVSNLAGCENCSSCDIHYESVDITLEAQKILSCVYRMHAVAYIKKSTLLDVLLGSEDVYAPALKALSTFGILSKLPREKVGILIAHLQQTGFITDRSTDEQNKVSLKKSEIYTKDVILAPTPKAATWLRSGDSLFMGVPLFQKTASHSINWNSAMQKLYVKLQKLRKLIAKRDGINESEVFSDRVLQQICEAKPKTPSDFYKLPAVTEEKVKRFGSDFAREISEFLKINRSTLNGKQNFVRNLERAFTKHTIGSDQLKSVYDWAQEEKDGLCLTAKKLGISVENLIHLTTPKESSVRKSRHK